MCAEPVVNHPHQERHSNNRDSCKVAFCTGDCAMTVRLKTTPLLQGAFTEERKMSSLEHSPSCLGSGCRVNTC